MTAALPSVEIKAPRLNRSSWPRLRPSGAARPSDAARPSGAAGPSDAARSARIVHLGVGNFSRSHQAWYTVRADPDRRWGIVAFSGRHPQAADVLARQDGLYTLIERGPREDRLSVIDTIIAAHPGTDRKRLDDAISDPRTALVTITITEAGYAPGPAAADGALARLTRALACRRQRGGGPLALVSCDNLRANGALLRTRVLELAVAADDDDDGPALAAWIDAQVSFVSTVVDRITPPATNADRALVRERLGVTDATPVVCEPFSDWVLCGEFPASRPAWEQAGARFVADTGPWEQRKLWLLNGGHCLLALLGLERGHRTVAQALADPQLSAALERYWNLAAAQLPAAALALPAYRAALRERFANARISYPLTQIATDSTAKLRERVVPVIEAARASGTPAGPALVVIAAWAKALVAGAGPLAGTGRGPLAPDAEGPQLEAALAAAGGEDRLRALLELLRSGWGSDQRLVAEVGRLLASGEQAQGEPTVAAGGLAPAPGRRGGS